MFQTIHNNLTDKIKPLDNQLNRGEMNAPIPLTKAIIWVMSASKGRGKTTTLLNVLKTKQKDGGLKKYFNNIFMFSPTARTDNKTKKLVEELEEDGKFYDEFNDTTGEEVIQRIKDYNKEFKNDKEHKGQEPRNLIIFDDSMTDLPKSFETKGGLNKLIIQARHNNTWCIFLVQRYIGVNRVIRSQADLISFWKTDNTRELQALTDDVNIDKDLMKAVYEFATDKPNDFLHINLLSRKFFKKFDEIII
jgi:hypothetical protein